MFKICSLCKENKSFNEFSRATSNKHGIRPACKSCENERNKQVYHARRKTHVRAEGGFQACSVCQQAKPYENFYTNKYRTLGITSICIPCNKEANSQWYYAHHEYAKSKLRQRNQARDKNVRNENRRNKYASDEIYRSEQKLLANIHHEKRRFTSLQPLYLNQFGTCNMCFQWFAYHSKLEIDHIFPVVPGLRRGLSETFLNRPENLQMLCRSCNGRKNDDTSLIPIKWALEDPEFWKVGNSTV